MFLFSVARTTENKNKARLRHYVPPNTLAPSPPRIRSSASSGCCTMRPAPARLTDFAGLAPAFIEVDELDIFRDESIRYAVSLMNAGVSRELHVHPGSPHGHDWLNPESAISKRVVAERVRVLTAL